MCIFSFLASFFLIFSILSGIYFKISCFYPATILNNLTPISKAEICKILPDVSATTVEAVLGAMVKDGSIIIVGSGRNTKYMRNV